MKRVIVFFILIFSNMYSYQVLDGLDLLTKEEKEILEKRVEKIHADYGLNFDILIFDEEHEEIQNNLNNLKKSVIIKLEKLKENNKMRVKLEISRDIELNSYEDDIKDLLDNLETLVSTKHYMDTIYELTGNIADIITLIELEKKEVHKEKINKNFKFIIFIVLGGIVFIGGMFYIIILIKEKSHLCKECNVEMDLIENQEMERKIIKVYTCKICGYTRKITSIRH